MKTSFTLLLTCLCIASAAPAQYSGGSGTADDPYQIATAADLIALGETPEDYDKHFILTADIDLDPNLPGRKVFDKAVIAGPSGTRFTGVFDGNGHVISLGLCPSSSEMFQLSHAIRRCQIVARSKPGR